MLRPTVPQYSRKTHISYFINNNREREKQTEKKTTTTTQPFAVYRIHCVQALYVYMINYFNLIIHDLLKLWEAI